MKILFFGNCQFHGLRWAQQLISANRIVSLHLRNYTTIELNAERLNDNLARLISKSDIVVMQPLSSKWGEYSTLESYVLAANKQCIVVPYIRIDGLWELYEDGKTEFGYPYIAGLENFSKNKVAILNNNPANEVADPKPSIYNDPFDQLERHSKSLKFLVSLEKKAIIVSDIYYLYFKRYRLMLTQNHPSSLWHVLIWQRICNMLSLEYESILEDGFSELADGDHAGLNGNSSMRPISRHSSNLFDLTFTTHQEWYSAMLNTRRILRQNNWR